DVAKVIDLRGAKRLRDADGNQQMAIAIAAETRRGLRFDDADNAKLFFFWHDAESTGAVAKLLPFGIANRKRFSDEACGVGRKFLGEFDLQDRFVGGFAGKKIALHSVKTAGELGRERHTGNDSWKRFVA